MDEDSRIYYTAREALIMNPTEGPNGGTYHVKNGQIYCGYDVVPIRDFSTSDHAKNVFGRDARMRVVSDT